MIFGNGGEKESKHGMYGTGHDAQEAPVRGHTHEAQEKGHDTDETQSQGDGRAGRLQHGLAQHLHASREGRHQDGKQDDTDEDSIQHEAPQEMWRTGII